MTVASRDGWAVERRVDTAALLHRPWPQAGSYDHRVVGLCSVVGRSAVVLGSTQPTDVVDVGRAERHGVDVVRRSSGGGAVLVSPATQVWLDVWIPRADPLWDDDVISSAWWLGETWARALEGLGAPALAVHRGRVTRSDWSDLVCFAGVGPGEVTTGTAKVVGVAQRRTRHGARLHSMASLSWEPARLVALLSHAEVRTLGADNHAVLEDVSTGLRDLLPLHQRHEGGDRIIATVERALVAALP